MNDPRPEWIFKKESGKMLPPCFCWVMRPLKLTLLEALSLFERRVPLYGGKLAIVLRADASCKGRA